MKDAAARQSVLDTLEYCLTSKSLFQTVGSKKKWLLKHSGNLLAVPAQMGELLDQALHHQAFIPFDNRGFYCHRIIGSEWFSLLG
jgi:hypothetical protein